MEYDHSLKYEQLYRSAAAGRYAKMKGREIVILNRAYCGKRIKNGEPVSCQNGE